MQQVSNADVIYANSTLCVVAYGDSDDEPESIFVVEYGWTIGSLSEVEAGASFDLDVTGHSAETP